MKHFKTSDGHVYAYTKADLDTVNNIKVLESELRDALDEETASSIQDNLDEILPVFFNIRDKLDGMVELKGAALKEHLNPAPTTEQIAEQALAQRTALLKEIDAIATHPLRWAEISEDDKASIGQYRLDVIDINNQPGFPHSINWPAKPSVIK